MSSLFGFFSDGRKDTSKGIVPTSAGYDQLYNEAKTAVKNGYRINPNDPDIARLAQQRGKPVEDLLKYDFGQY